MPPRQPISIRRSMLRNLALLIILTSGTILVASWITGAQAVEDLSRSLIDRTATRTETELDRFFGDVHSNVIIGTDWARAGILDPTDHEAMNTLFVPILRQHPQLSSMMVATSEGVEYLLLRDPIDSNVWTNRIVQADAWGMRVFNRTWNSTTGESQEGFGELDYDPRQRIWYREALEARPGQEVFWTRPVIFFITKDPGITAATHWVADGRTYVVAFDLLLLDISRFTARFPVSDGGTAFVLAEGDAADSPLKVVGLPRDEHHGDDASIRDALMFLPPDAAVADADAQLPPADTLAAPGVAGAVDRWLGRGKPEQAFRFRSGGAAWWGGFHSYPLGDNTLWIGVVVPERDFLGDIVRQRNVTLIVSLAALLVALVMALVMSRNYGRPLEALAHSSRRIRKLDLEDHRPINSSLAEVSQLAEAQQQMLSALQSFSKYVPMEVVRELVHRGEVAQIGGSSESLTILFTDISGFTSIAEQMTPEALTSHMAEYFNEMLGILSCHGATVDKLVGDAIVAFWGAPRRDPDHAVHAMTAVMECVERLAECNTGWTERGLPVLRTRFGLSTGTVIVGNVGSESRLNYTVLGDTVNLAARLEALNRAYGTEVLVDEGMKDATELRFDWRLVDLVAVKGKERAVRVYEPLGPVGETDEERLDFARSYEHAWSLYQDRRFADALSAVHELLRNRPDDPSLARLRYVCEEYASKPPPVDWDGVARMTTK